MYVFHVFRGQKVRAFMFCNPNNPLGVVYPKSLGKTKKSLVPTYYSSLNVIPLSYFLPHIKAADP
jgi:hypothetical protein